MKKVLLTLIMSVVLGGTVFAQYYPSTEFYNPNGYDTYFNTAYEFNSGQFENTDYPSAYLRCNDALINTDDRWYDYEVGSFVGDELRGFCFMTTMYVEDGYLPMFDNIFIYNTTPGEVVTFKVYDHGTGIEYDCDINLTILTGDDSNYYGVYDDPEGVSDESLYISFTAEEPQLVTFTKDIIGYGDPSNPGGYYLIASPVQETLAPTQVNHMTDNAFDLYYFNQDVDDDHPWINYKVDEAGTEFDADFTIVPFKGYLYANSADVTLEFTGTPYEGDGIVELDYVEDKPYSGWNLIGNPFAVTAYLLLEDESDYVDFYIMDDTIFRLATFEESYIDPMCAVLVEATEELQTVKFDTEGKSKHQALNMSLTRNSGDVMDVARLRFNNGRATHKFQLNPSSTKVYFTVDNEDYAVVNAPEMGEMPVSFKAESNGTYTLSFTSEEVSFNYLHLIDNMTGADVDLLATPSYSFDATTTDYASRFRLVFATGSNSDDNFAFFSNGSFVISNEGEATLQVVDVTGRILSNKTINGSASVHVDAAPGVYMLRLVNGDNVKVQKVVVR